MLGVDLGAYSVKFCLTRKKGENFEPVFLGEKLLASQSLVGGEIRDKGYPGGQFAAILAEKSSSPGSGSFFLSPPDGGAEYISS